MLQTITVEGPTLVLLKKLQQIPQLNHLRLVGGTALALQLGHRNSVDLDLFGIVTLSLEEMTQAMENAGLEVSFSKKRGGVYLFVVNNVKVDIVNFPLEWFEPAIETEDVKMAGLKDIVAMKMAAITGRGRKKDFIDFYFLLKYFSLNQAFDLYLKKYPNNAIENAMMSLTYFVDAEKDTMPKMFIDIDWEDIKSTIRDAVRGLQ
jgi:hypothetical protein